MLVRLSLLETPTGNQPLEDGQKIPITLFIPFIRTLSAPFSVKSQPQPRFRSVNPVGIVLDLIADRSIHISNKIPIYPLTPPV